MFKISPHFFSPLCLTNLILLIFSIYFIFLLRHSNQYFQKISFLTIQSCHLLCFISSTLCKHVLGLLYLLRFVINSTSGFHLYVNCPETYQTLELHKGRDSHVINQSCCNQSIMPRLSRCFPSLALCSHSFWYSILSSLNPSTPTVEHKVQLARPKSNVVFK